MNNGKDHEHTWKPDFYEFGGDELREIQRDLVSDDGLSYWMLPVFCIECREKGDFNILYEAN